ncbi:hypothetical protein KIPE111705_13855 [Kibdelosporangium persicum]|uniref:PPE family protein n=1 Tax=Kibdelosporangium persicum TaxID=2698649 RepID=A0ABX2F9Q3_9PSEU|nr:hypothetical protein [Kibdelosporangium persicum]NRN68094.1 hypothetical protein [Kibdelosporangium persicum]
MFLSGQDIYENFTNARGPADMASGADVVAEVVKTYNERGDQIKKLLNKMDAVWKGDAAGAAHRGVGPLAVEHALAAPAMDTMRDLVSRQAGSFNDAKNAVMPVPPAPEKVDPLAAFLAPGELVTYQQQLGRHHAAAQHNADVMRGYENASTYNMNLPSTYGSITADQSEIRIAQAPPPSQPPPPGDRPSPPKPRTTAPPPPIRGGEGPGGTGSNVTRAGGPGDGPGGSGVVVSPSQSTAPPGTTPGGYTSPAPGPGLGTSGSGVLVGASPGPGAGGPGLGFFGPGAVPGEGAGSPGHTGAPGAAGGGSVAGGPGPAGRTGAGPVSGPGAAAEAAAARNVPAGRGTPGGLPMSAVPGGRNQGSEDEEHRRASFLEEPDPEAVFGTDKPTAPPVIGG